MTRIPSRRMPPYKEDIPLVLNVIGYSLPVLMLIWVIYDSWHTSKIGLSLFLLFTVLFLLSAKYYNDKQLKKLALMRKNEDIGTFTRSFNYREIDTWVIRAVYEAFYEHMTFSKGICPLRSSDKLKDIFTIEIDAIEHIIYTVLHRTNRTEENMDKNPYYDKVHTVKDLVLFLDAQPRLKAKPSTRYQI